MECFLGADSGVQPVGSRCLRRTPSTTTMERLTGLTSQPPQAVVRAGSRVAAASVPDEAGREAQSSQGDALVPPPRSGVSGNVSLSQKFLQRFC